MGTESNFQVRLAARPEGMPTRQHWEMSSTEIVWPSDGEVLVKTAFISIDPAMRGWLRDAKSYLPPVAIGEVMRAGGVGTIIASKHPDLKEGEQVVGHIGVQSHALVQGGALRKVSDKVAPLSTYLGVLGMPGMTAYFGMTDVGALEIGDTVLVSAAAGAVGSIAGQLETVALHDLGDGAWTDELAGWQAVRTSEANAAAQAHIDPSDIVIVIVGDRAKVEAPLRELGIAEVEVLSGDF